VARREVCAARESKLLSAFGGSEWPVQSNGVGEKRLPDGTFACEKRLEGVNALVAHVRRSASEPDFLMESLSQFGKRTFVTKTEQECLREESD